ncbi:MAG: sulfotransferase family protein [Hyphomicrobiales bacterium]|nr:sulfotransferase family protein [Hyphomicrobiales bacterium]
MKSDKLRLIYVTNPKAASSSIFKLLLELSGIQVDMPARKALRRASYKEIARDAGVSRVRFSRRRARRFQKEHKGYIFFTFVRDPYGRCISNYHNKLNRVAKQFSPRDYYMSKALHIARGPSAWASHLNGVAFLKNRISFEQYVHLLQVKGIDFSNHFAHQRQAISYQDLKFDFIGKVENFDNDISALLEKTDLPRDRNAASRKNPHENISKSDQDKAVLLTDELREAIFALYQPDFETFDYDRNG